jgi:hypothetical protein
MEPERRTRHGEKKEKATSFLDLRIVGRRRDNECVWPKGREGGKPAVVGEWDMLGKSSLLKANGRELLPQPPRVHPSR